MRATQHVLAALHAIFCLGLLVAGVAIGFYSRDNGKPCSHNGLLTDYSPAWCVDVTMWQREHSLMEVYVCKQCGKPIKCHQQFGIDPEAEAERKENE